MNYKQTLSEHILIIDGDSHPIITIPKVLAGTYKFSWISLFNSLDGNGNNGQLSIGFSDNFISSSVLNTGTFQFVCLAPDGSALNGISNPLYSGIPSIVTQANTSLPLNTQIAIQTGSITLPTDADISLYFAAGQFDPTDKQIITDTILILEKE